MFSLLGHAVIAQKGLLEILEEEQREIPQYTLGTFKATRIGIGHSVETRGQGILDLMVNNRYCNTPTRYSQSMGPEKLNTRIALEYGIDDRLSAGEGVPGTDFLMGISSTNWYASALMEGAPP